MKNIVLGRSVSHREYTTYGVNAEMLACLTKSNWFKRIFSSDYLEENILFRAIASPSYAERVQCGKSCVNEIWKNIVPFGPYPLLDLLSEFEFDRQFYSGYRDHVTHQLKVFLLGIYVYESCPPIQKIIDLAYGNQDEFLLRWVLSAFFHDLGYVFEIGDASDHTHTHRTIKTINKIYHDPFNDFIKWHFGPILLPAQSEAIRKKLEIKTPNLSYFDDIRVNSRDNDLLDAIENRVKSTNLCENTKPLQTYLRYAMANKPKNSKRPGFIDHGIASSYLLLHLYDMACEWSVKVSEQNSINQIDPDIFEELKNKYSVFQKIKECVYDAAAAIALHNIDSEIWDMNHAYRWEKAKLTLHKFNIELEKLPLAFLLGLVDIIQEWDRPRFSSPKGIYDWPQDIQSQDLHVLPCKEKLLVSYPGDPLSLTDHSESHFYKLFKEINAILKWNEKDLTINEIAVKDIISILESTSWGELILSSINEAEKTLDVHSFISDEKNSVKNAYNLYRRGRSLANNATWIASAECHYVAYERFLENRMNDWAARSLGRVAYNKFDLGKENEALSHLSSAKQTDELQGIANYYWAIQHCIRAKGSEEFTKNCLENLIRGIGELPEFKDYFLALCKAKNEEQIDKFMICIVNFFQELVAHEISSGWPLWAMSDMARLYAIRAELSPEVADTLFEAAAEAYKDAELSSYAAWCNARAQLYKTKKKYDIKYIYSQIIKSQDYIRAVVQRPGGIYDPVRVGDYTLSIISDIILFLINNDEIYITTAISLRDEALNWLPTVFAEDFKKLFQFVKKAQEEVRSETTMSKVLPIIKNLIHKIIYEENRRYIKYISPHLKKAILSIFPENIKKYTFHE